MSQLAVNVLPKVQAHKFYGLDHLRAWAIVSVFLFHYQTVMFAHPQWLTEVASFGWTGVDLFFVLSGFLISSKLFLQIQNQQQIAFGSFFRRRFFRILPAYFVVLGFYFLIPVFRERERLSPLWKFLTFTLNFGLDLRVFGTFSHAWSLCVEEHFYLLLPIVLACLLRARLFNKSYLLLLVLLLLGIVTRHDAWIRDYQPYAHQKGAWAVWYEYLYYPTYQRLDGLLVGVSIAALRQYYPCYFNSLEKRGNYLLILGLFVFFGAYYLCLDSHSYAASVFGFPLVSLSFGLWLLAALSPSCFLFRWQSKTTTFIATLSYGVYLSHKGIIHLVQLCLGKFNVDVNSALTLVVSALVSLLAAFVLYQSIEKPFMKLGQTNNS